MQYKLLLFCLLICTNAFAQEFTPIYDEEDVPAYTLPPILVDIKGTAINSIEDWETYRRNEILEVIQNELFGKTPTNKYKVDHKTLESSTEAINGKAIRKQVRITFKRKGKVNYMDLLIYLPKQVEKPVPVFLGANFYGNHAIENDPEILLSESWMRNNEAFGITNHKATEKSRGGNDHRWPVEYIIDQGFGVATYYCGDIDPDVDDDFKNGIHALFKKNPEEDLAPDEWGTIAAWAWGLSRALDYFSSDPSIAEDKVAVIGHSRLGKAALCAGAYDERFAMVISNESGCGGAALSKRTYGETVERINSRFTHWFCDNYNQYNNNESNMPFDQHMLLALIAPRPIYVASAAGDQWADPTGEFLALKEASEVYALYQLDNLSDEKMPDIDSPILKGFTSYHIRAGKHDVTKYDWEQYIAYAKNHLK